MRTRAPLILRSSWFALSISLLAGATPSVVRADAAPAETAAAVRSMSLEDALAMGMKNNRDLQAARERLRGSYSDVERALASLMPTVNLQGKMTINEPQVSLNLDQSGSVFNAAYQGAQLFDLNGGARGPAASALFNSYCNNTDPNRMIPAGVQGVCDMLKNPAGSVGGLDASLSSANIAVTIVPRVQIDGVLALNMPLISPSLYPTLKGARLGFKAQEKQLEVTVAQVLTTIATSFYAAAGNEELVSARTHGIEVAQKTLDNAKVRLAAGVVNKVEVTRAALALIQAEQRLLEAIDGRASSYRTLATLIRSEAGTFKVVPPPEPPTELQSEQQLIEQAVRQRPELVSNRIQTEALGQQVFASWLRWSPSLSLFGNARLTNATGFAGRVDSYAIGLQLDWLLFDGFARDAQRHSLEAQRRDANLRLEQLRDTITDDVVNGRRAVLTKKQGLATAERSVAMAKETLELVRTQYQAGTATQLDLLNAQDAQIQAEVGVAQARFDLSLAVLNIRRLIGENLADAASAPGSASPTSAGIH